MPKEKKKPRFPRLKCPSERVFVDKKKKRIKGPTPEELRDLEGNYNE